MVVVSEVREIWRHPVRSKNNIEYTNKTVTLEKFDDTLYAPKQMHDTHKKNPFWACTVNVHVALFSSLWATVL